MTAPGAPPEREPVYLVTGHQIAALRNDIDFLKSFGALSRAEIETFDDLEIRLCEIELNEADQK